MNNTIVRKLEELRPVIKQLEPVLLQDFLEINFPDREPMLAPWLTVSSLHIVYASRGVGKTHFSLGVAKAVSTGGEFLHWNADKARNVLYIDGEMAGASMAERLKDLYQQTEGISLKLFTPDLVHEMPDLGTLEGQESISNACDWAELIIVDNLATLTRSCNNNDDKIWLDVQSWAIRLRAKGKAIIFVHHSGKNGEQRGTSRKEDVLDTSIELRHPTNYDESTGCQFELQFKKARGLQGEDVQRTFASLSDGIWSFRPLEKENYERVIDCYCEGMNKQKEIAEEIGISQSQVSRYIKKAKKEGRV